MERWMGRSGLISKVNSGECWARFWTIRSYKEADEMFECWDFHQLCCPASWHGDWYDSIEGNVPNQALVQVQTNSFWLAGWEDKGHLLPKHLIAIPWPMTSELDVCPKMTLLTCEVVKLGQVLTHSQVRGNTGREHSISRSQRRLFCCGLQISKTQAMFGKALDMYDKPS